MTTYLESDRILAYDVIYVQGLEKANVYRREKVRWWFPGSGHGINADKHQGS